MHGSETSASQSRVWITLAQSLLCCGAVTNRKQQRVPTKQVVRYHVYEVAGRRLEVQGLGTTLASDISSSGMFLSHASLTPGTSIHFYFELPTGYIEAVGKVVHNQQRIDASGVARPGAGVRFIRMSASDLSRLESYLDGRSASHRISEVQPTVAEAPRASFLSGHRGVPLGAAREVGLTIEPLAISH